MRIESSNISFQATHRAATADAVIDQSLARTRNAAAADSVQLSSAASSNGDSDELSGLSPKEAMAVLVMQAVFGQKFKFLHQSSGGSGGNAAAAANARVNAGVVHQRTTLHSEMEQTNFHAQGTVVTSDGRRIQFSAGLAMEHQFQSASVTTSNPAQTQDPLVVNFGGAPAQLTGGKVSFDLNSDGTPEAISFVGSGSGFLALDKNGDGKVNDGSELFGPHTGQGFAELASYDSDGNGWIDEGDPIYSKLRIWTADEGLSTLADKGVGAISVSSTETPFALKDSQNILQGNVRATGVYLSNNGAVGTIQQVDLAV